MYIGVFLKIGTFIPDIQYHSFSGSCSDFILVHGKNNQISFCGIVVKIMAVNWHRLKISGHTVKLLLT